MSSSHTLQLHVSRLEGLMLFFFYFCSPEISSSGGSTLVLRHILGSQLFVLFWRVASSPLFSDPASTCLKMVEAWEHWVGSRTQPAESLCSHEMHFMGQQETKEECLATLKSFCYSVQSNIKLILKHFNHYHHFIQHGRMKQLANV